MKVKSRYRPSDTIEALFTAAAVKIKAATDRAVAEQEALWEPEDDADNSALELELGPTAETDPPIAAEPDSEPALQEDPAQGTTEAGPEPGDEAPEFKDGQLWQSGESEKNKESRPSIESTLDEAPEQWPEDSGLCAKDVMRRDLFWASPDDSVEKLLPRMGDNGVQYVLIGRDGLLEGLVSDTDLAAAMSPYLRPEFAQYRQSSDEATLQIKLKWIMSRPVFTIDQSASLLEAIQVMQKTGKLCLPTTDKEGSVQGLVTESDIFKVMLKP